MEIILKNLQQKIPIPQAKILKAAKTAISKIGDRHFFDKSSKKVSVPYFLSIVFVGTRRMRVINNKYLGHDYVTDVLTFDFGDSRQGEIIICPRVAAINARKYQTSTEKEIILYVIHGILHLAGYDDHSPKDIIEMRRMEKELL